MPRKKVVNPSIIEASQQIDIELFRESVRGGFANVKDPREPRNISFPLWYLLLVVLAGYLSGCNTISDLESFGRLRHDWLVGLTGVATRSPSYDTLWMLLVRLTPEGMKKFLQQWFSKLGADLKGQVLAIDGKRARGATYLGSVVHLVELVFTDTGITVTQERVPSKQGELAALDPILEQVNVEGAILSLDALYTTRKIASLIRSKHADYLLALKGNQGKLHDEVRNFFAQARAVQADEAGIDMWEEQRDGHGRRELVRVSVCHDLTWLPQKSEWTDLTSIVEVVTIARGDNSQATRYYISSCSGSAQDFAGWIRSHWAIENNVHWVADVVFREDASKAATGHAQENMALFRRLAMNIIRCFDPGTGIAEARRTCCHSQDYLQGVLTRLFVKTL